MSGFDQVTLVLGGARSGKSAWSEAQIRQFPSPWIYIATGQAYDDEMRARIGLHQDRRGEGWMTVEEPLDLAAVLLQQEDRPVLVDCLTLWLTNLLLGEHDIALATQRLFEALEVRLAPTYLVSNEVGLGIVPDNALARRFRDEAGRLHQACAARAGHVVLCVAGLPLVFK